MVRFLRDFERLPFHCDHIFMHRDFLRSGILGHGLLGRSRNKYCKYRAD